MQKLNELNFCNKLTLSTFSLKKGTFLKLLQNSKILILIDDNNDNVMLWNHDCDWKYAKYDNIHNSKRFEIIFHWVGFWTWDLAIQCFECSSQCDFWKKEFRKKLVILEKWGENINNNNNAFKRD